MQIKILRQKFGENVIIKKFEKQKGFLLKKLSSSMDNTLDSLLDNIYERSIWQKFGL